MSPQKDVLDTLTFSTLECYLFIPYEDRVFIEVIRLIKVTRIGLDPIKVVSL